MTFAEDLKDRYPDTATVVERMAGEERDHRHRLLAMYEVRFGQHLPPIRREDVRGLLRPATDLAGQEPLARHDP